MYGIPLEPASILLKQSLILESNSSWVPHHLTKTIVLVLASGANGSGGGANGAIANSGGNGGLGGVTSFGSYSVNPNIFYGTGGSGTGVNTGTSGACNILGNLLTNIHNSDFGGIHTGISGTNSGGGGDPGLGGYGGSSIFGPYGTSGTNPVQRNSAIAAGAQGGYSEGNGGGAGGGSASSHITAPIIITEILPSYAVVIGAGGAAGTSGGGGTVPGKAGGQGFAEVWEYS